MSLLDRVKMSPHPPCMKMFPRTPRPPLLSSRSPDERGTHKTRQPCAHAAHEMATVASGLSSSAPFSVRRRVAYRGGGEGRSEGKLRGGIHHESTVGGRRKGTVPVPMSRVWGSAVPSQAPARASTAVARGGTVDAGATFDLDALMPQEIDGDLEGLQEEAGAEFDDEGIPLNYGDTAAEALTITSKVGILDRTGRWHGPCSEDGGWDLHHTAPHSCSHAMYPRHATPRHATLLPVNSFIPES